MTELSVDHSSWQPVQALWWWRGGGARWVEERLVSVDTTLSGSIFVLLKGVGAGICKVEQYSEASGSQTRYSSGLMALLD